jgi:DNA-binding transcriptional LysR family regulator
METLANLESFVRSAEASSFSVAARRLSLTPAAVSRNVAMLERNLGVRLFQRTTRKLTLTEAGERFLLAMQDHMEGLQAAIAEAGTDRGEPAGVLKVSMGLTFGADYISCRCCPPSSRAIPTFAPTGGSRAGRST